MTYGVDFDSLPSMDDTETVAVPNTQVSQSSVQALLDARIDPLDPSADNDLGVSCYSHAVHVLNDSQ